MVVSAFAAKSGICRILQLSRHVVKLQGIDAYMRLIESGPC